MVNTEFHSRCQRAPERQFRATSASGPYHLPPVSVVPVDDWPLVGRARELARVNAALTRPAGSGVLLAGPSGVGKSRLAGECLRRAADHGFHVEHVRATRSSSQIPLGASAPLLPFDNTGEVAGDVLRGVAAAIGATRDDGRRLLLAVDDAHLLDDASATVVNHLVTSGRCSVMLTVRTGESAPDPVTAGPSDFDAVIDPTDTDGDGLTDSFEQAYGTKVHDLDTDNDGITDGAEVLLGTDPLSVDTDGDGVGDFGEVAGGTDPLVADPNPASGPLPLDTDGDGLYDEQEWAAGTNPFLDDTDDDGISDLNELITGSDPLTADRQRLDLSGVDLTPPPSGGGSIPPEFEEWLEGINDLFAEGDSDGDGLSDAMESGQYPADLFGGDGTGTDPFNPDTDGDGMSDGEEVGLGFDPLDPNGDADGDGVSDVDELAAGTDPFSAGGDADGDHLSDADEVQAGTVPFSVDSDGDFLTDEQEALYGTDPLSPDTDGDGYLDGHEVHYGTNPTTLPSAVAAAPDDVAVGLAPDPAGAVTATAPDDVSLAPAGSTATDLAVDPEPASGEVVGIDADAVANEDVMEVEETTPTVELVPEPEPEPEPERIELHLEPDSEPARIELDLEREPEPERIEVDSSPSDEPERATS